ncbi:MAG: ankyrin repeat domain-containing protein, partial [Candidatus Limnocylindrales bacterium]
MVLPGNGSGGAVVGGNARAEDPIDATALFQAIRAGDLATVDRILTEQPAAAAASDDAGLSAVTVAAYHGQPAIVERILAAGPDLDRFEAAIVGDVERLGALLDEAGREREMERETAGRRPGGPGRADRSNGPVSAGPTEDAKPIDERSTDGFTALHLAAFFGRPEVARLLLDRGADLNRWAGGDLYVQPLHSAVAGGHADVAAMLILGGADIDAPQRHGYTPLMGAAQNGMAATVQLLLARGANPTARNDDVLTAAELADRAGHPAVAATIRAAG